MNPDEQSVIDVHAHLVPDGLIERVRAGRIEGVSVADGPNGPVLHCGQDSLGPFPPGMLDVGGRLAWMDSRRIDVQWVSPWLDLFTWHRFEAAAAANWSAAVTETLTELTAASGGRLRPVPHLDLAAGPATALAELDCALGVPAVLVNAQPGAGVALTDPALDPVWAALSDRQLPVLLHPPVDGPSCGFTAPVLQNVSGRIIDTSVAVLDMLVAGVLDRFESLVLIVVHGGGYLPYQTFRLDGLARAGLLAKTAATSSPSQALRRLYFDTVALDEPSLRLLLSRVGPNHVLLGSDAPFPIGDPDPVTTIERTGLDPDSTARLLSGNAAGLARAGAPTGLTR